MYDLTRQLFPEVIPVTAPILDHAREILDSDSRIMARDALQAAVVIAERMEAIYSFDRDFDRIAGIKRIEPTE